MIYKNRKSGRKKLVNPLLMAGLAFVSQVPAQAALEQKY
jgi:hypothetical protein